MFQKGQSGNPAGKKPGTKNKETINYLDFQLWFGKISRDLEQIEDPKERIEIGLRIVDRMLSKTANLPGTPAQSVENVQKMVEAYETQKANAIPSVND